MVDEGADADVRKQQEQYQLAGHWRDQLAEEMSVIGHWERYPRR